MYLAFTWLLITLGRQIDHHETVTKNFREIDGLFMKMHANVNVSEQLQIWGVPAVIFKVSSQAWRKSGWLEK